MTPLPAAATQKVTAVWPVPDLPGLPRVQALVVAHVAVLVELAVVGLVVGWCVVRVVTLMVWRWRHRRLSEHPARVSILPPPDVEVAGGVVFWATLAEVLAAGPRRRRLYGNPHVAVEFRWAGRELTISCWVPGPVPARLVAAAARAAWPGASTDITEATPPLPVDPPSPPSVRRWGWGQGPGLRRRRGGPVVVGGVIVPALAAWYPLRDGQRGDRDGDLLRPLLEAASAVTGDQHACVQVLARPARPAQVARVRRAVVALRAGRPVPAVAGVRLDPGAWLVGVLLAGVRLVLDAVLDLFTPAAGRARAGAGSAVGRIADPVRDRDARAALEVATGQWWEVAVRYGVAHTNPRGLDRGADRARLRKVLVVTADGIASAFGVHAARNRYRRLPLRHPAQVLAARRLDRGFLLPAVSLAAIATLPTDVSVPGLDRAGATPRPAPVAVPTGGRATKPLGRATVGGHAVALPVADARQHLHVLGATGSGKSTLMTHLILDDVTNRRGVVVIDPKGDLALDVLDRLPASAVDRLVVIDPDQPVGGATLNPLEVTRGGDDDLVVDNIVSIFAKTFARHWGPRIDDVMRVACLTLLRHPNPTLANIPPLLNRKQFRAPLVADLDDPEGLGGFWEWYDTSPPALRAQVIGPVLARLRAFLLRDFVKATVGVTTSTLDMSRVLDGGILVARLPKGQLGEDTAKLLGSFVLGSVWQAATLRARLPERRRRDATCYVDEAHNVLNLAGSVSDMLAEARGYRLSLVLAHQELGQLPRETLTAVSANARNKLVFACSPEDAKVMARHTLPELGEHDLANLDAYTAAARLVIGARPTRAFTLATRPPATGAAATGRLADVRAAIAARARDVVAARSGRG